MLPPHTLSLAWHRALSELRAEAARTYAGYLWWILEPFLAFLIYFVAFRYVIGTQMENFAIFLFCGVVTYTWFSATLLRSATCITNATPLMQIVYFHKVMIPLSLCFVNLIKFLVTFGVLVGVVLVLGGRPTVAWLSLPLLLAVEFGVILGASFLLSSLTPFMPDIEMFLVRLLHLLIFVSGVFFRLDRLPEGLQALIRINPMVGVIEAFRTVLVQGAWPRFDFLALALAEGLVLGAVGLVILHRFDRIYPKIA